MLLIIVGDGEDVVEYFFVGIGENNISASHYAFGNGKEFNQRNIGKSGTRTFGKTWHEVARESSSMNIHSNAYHGGCVENAVYAGF